MYVFVYVCVCAECEVRDTQDHGSFSKFCAEGKHGIFTKNNEKH